MRQANKSADIKFNFIEFIKTIYIVWSSKRKKPVEINKTCHNWDKLLNKSAILNVILEN